MAVHTDRSSPSAPLRRVLRLLEDLNATHGGSAIFHHVERSLQALEQDHFESEGHYIELIELLLDTLSRQAVADSPALTQIHILRASLIAPLQPHDLQQLKDACRRLQIQLGQPRSGAVAAAIDPLLNAASRPVPQTAPTSPWINRNDGDAPLIAPEQSSALSLAPLREGRANIQGVKSQLNEQISLALEQNRTLADLIRESMEAMQPAAGEQDIEELRTNQQRRYTRLIKEHQDLTTRFSAIQQQLDEMESESQQLDEELSRVHRLSLTDELTQLPNRRALMQRLGDEVARVQRYGFPLALAIIDLDEFKPINDTFGHNAGDAVLRYFAETALAAFRHHDTVARYGGEEFAVLMPNTELEGALSALKKIQSESGGSLCRIDDGVEISVPTFSAGVAIYNPGETPEELIKRADTAMYRAKRSGRNRIEVHTMGAKTTALWK